VAALVKPVIVQDSDHRRDDGEGHEVGRWSMQGLLAPFLPSLAGTAIQEISISKLEETLKPVVNQIIVSAGAIKKTLQNIDLEEFQDRLESKLIRVFEQLQNEFSEPLPEDKTERYKRQEIMITQAFEKIEDAVVDVCSSHWKIPEDTVRADFDKIKPHLNHALLIVANFANNHPDLVVFLCSSVIMAIIPESFILRPILRLFGFSRMGPVKGSIAARAQSFFYGPKVPKGSLFAWLQRAGAKMGDAILKFFFLAFHVGRDKAGTIRAERRSFVLLLFVFQSLFVHCQCSVFLVTPVAINNLLKIDPDL